MAPNRVIALVKDRAGIELALGGAKDRFHQPQLLVLSSARWRTWRNVRLIVPADLLICRVAFIAASNKCIAAMEAKADQQPARKAR